MAQLAPMMQLRARFEDKCGHPLAGGTVFAFEVGTSTPKDTFADANGTIPNTHPIKLDYRGEADIFLLSGRYRFVVYSCTGVKIYDVDNVGEWLGIVSAVNVIDGDKDQHQINSEQADKNLQLEEKIITEVEAEKSRASTAEANLSTSITGEKERALAAEQILSNSISNETSRATAAEEGLQTQINSLGGGVYGFNTYAEFDAVKATIPVNSVVNIAEVNSGSGSWGQGDNIWDGVTLKKSPYDPLTQSLNYTNEKVDMISTAIELKRADDPNIICFAADALGYALAYYDKVKECFVGAGLLESIFDLLAPLKKYQDGRYIPGKLDADGRMLWGWDTLLNRFVCGESFSSQQSKNYRYFPQKPLTAEVNHLLGYGESLSVGAKGVPVISITQPYANITFSKGPRLDPLGSGEVLGIIGLVEQFNNPAADGGTDRGETFCSGAANYASQELLKQGTPPQSHVIFASTAGQGGATIAALARGGSTFARLLNHANKAKELNSGKSYVVPMIPFSIGVNDAAVGTSYESFKTTLDQVCTDINTFVKPISGQSQDIIFALTQTSYGVKTSPQISKALWDLTVEKSNFVFVTPTYHFPHDADATHLTSVGYKWMGAYYGRVYSQYINEGRYPDYIKPLSAYVEGNKVIIKFDAPTLPLQIDKIALAETTNAGFKVLNGSTEIPIVNDGVSATDDTVIIQLTSTPTNNVQVRYAKDYLGAGLNILNGASGNLRDSTTDVVDIANISRPLFHVCPHFELTAYLVKGI